MCDILKMAGHRAKRGENWDSWDTSNTIYGVSVQGHFGNIRCIYLKMTCISNTAGRRAKRNEIWDSGILVTHKWGIFDLLGSRSFWDHSGHLSHTRMYLKNGWS